MLHLSEEAQLEINGLFRGPIPLAGRALDLRAERHNWIASNLANMDTPHYKAFDVMVEEELERMDNPGQGAAVRKTHPGHLSRPPGTSAGEGRLEAHPGQPYGSVEGNTVDVDREMAKLTENSLKFSTTAQILSAKLRGLKSAIQGGR